MLWESGLRTSLLPTTRPAWHYTDLAKEANDSWNPPTVWSQIIGHLVIPAQAEWFIWTHKTCITCSTPLSDKWPLMCCSTFMLCITLIFFYRECIFTTTHFLHEYIFSFFSVFNMVSLPSVVNLLYLLCLSHLSLFMITDLVSWNDTEAAFTLRISMTRNLWIRWSSSLNFSEIVGEVLKTTHSSGTSLCHGGADLLCLNLLSCCFSLLSRLLSSRSL